MSRRKIIGYNNQSSISIHGTRLISTSGELLILPARYKIVEMEIKKLPSLNRQIPNVIIIYLFNPIDYTTTDLKVINIAEFNYTPIITIHPMIKLNEYDQIIMVRSEQEEMNNISICTSVKIKK